MHFSFLQKFGGALLVTVWLVWGSHMIGDMLIPEYTPPQGSGTAVAAVPSGGGSAKKEEPLKVEPIGPLLASASVDDGASIFKKCHACHNIEKGGGNKVGPDLWNVVGANKAHQPDFAYSDAMQNKGGTWTYEDLNHFLTKPKAYIPGTKMGFAGLKKAEDRAAVIAYLREHSDNPPPLP